MLKAKVCSPVNNRITKEGCACDPECMLEQEKMDINSAGPDSTPSTLLSPNHLEFKGISNVN